MRLVNYCIGVVVMLAGLWLASRHDVQPMRDRDL